MACGILAPWSGKESAPSALEGKFLTLDGQGKSLFLLRWVWLQGLEDLKTLHLLAWPSSFIQLVKSPDSGDAHS